MVIRAYLICALMTSILGIISCSVHDIINWYPFILLYAWIILSPISILALITVYLLGVQRDWICKIPLICLCAFIVYFFSKNNLIDLSIGWQFSAASLNSTIFNGLFYEKCNEI
mgnify:CR=1 FL=1